jgi:tetratricopeptide (TPR) repeat protein
MRLLGDYYWSRRNYRKMKYYFRLAYKHGDTHSAYLLGNYYMEKGREDKALKIYLSGVNKNDPSCAYELAMYYLSMGDFDNLEKYLWIGVQQNDITCIQELGKHFCEIEQYDDMKLCYKKGVEIGNAFAMYLLGDYYRQVKKYKKMEKYFVMALENNTDDMFADIRQHEYHLRYSLSDYYFELKDYDSAMKYNENFPEYHEEIIAVNKALEKDFDIGLAVKLKNKISITNLKTLNNIVRNYEYCVNNSEKLFVKDECLICFEKKNLVTLNCKHRLCSDCLNHCIINNINGCYLCRSNIASDGK